MKKIKGRPKTMMTGARKRSIKISTNLDQQIHDEILKIGMQSYSEFFRFITNVYFRKKSKNTKYWLMYLNDYTLRR